MGRGGGCRKAMETPAMATGLMMSPLRRVSGEPCSGMLPSVG